MQQGDNKMETADMMMNRCSLSGPGGAMENSTTHKNIRTCTFPMLFYLLDPDPDPGGIS